MTSDVTNLPIHGKKIYGSILRSGLVDARAIVYDVTIDNGQPQSQIRGRTPANHAALCD